MHQPWHAMASRELLAGTMLRVGCERLETIGLIEGGGAVLVVVADGCNWPAISALWPHRSQAAHGHCTQFPALHHDLQSSWRPHVDKKAVAAAASASSACKMSAHAVRIDSHPRHLHQRQ